MACQPTKCCCCAPLRPGLLAWAYTKLVFALGMTGYLLYIDQYRILHLPERIEERASYKNAARVIFETLYPHGVFFLYLVFSIIFLIGVHRENFKLLLTFLVSSIFEVLAACVWFGFEMEVFVHVLTHYQHYLEHVHPFPLDEPSFYLRLIVPLVFNILLPLYFMVLIKSELQRLKRGGKTVVLNQPETKQAATYNYVYVYYNDTPKLRKPLFPVEELQRLRQQMGVNNV